MASKGLHTLVQAAIKLRSMGIFFHVHIAGTPFQKGYKVSDISLYHSLQDDFFFLGQLSRQSLVRFWSLQHIGVFPSIHPEAFGISAAEIMCSGLLLCSTGVGGASRSLLTGIVDLLLNLIILIH